MIAKNKKYTALFIALILIVIGVFYYLQPRYASINNFEPFHANFFNYDDDIDDDEEDLKNALSTGNYTGRMYYALFNDLYFRINNDPTMNNCIETKATPECAFYNAIVTNDETACSDFPYMRTAGIPGKYGTAHTNLYYQMTCTLNVRLHTQLTHAPDKFNFCSSVVGNIEARSCIWYVCQDNYWNTQKPAACSELD